MSKIFDTYLKLKKSDKSSIYLFKNGIFFIAIDDDAYKLSKIFNFKLGYLRTNVVKCGFPCSSLDKYINLFNIHNLKIKIIELEKNTISSLTEFNQSIYITGLLEFINNIDVDSLSISDAYELLENLKEKVKNIYNMEL